MNLHFTLRLRYLLLGVFLCTVLPPAMADKVTVTSPNGRISVALSTDRSIAYTVSLDGRPCYEMADIGLIINGQNLGHNAAATKVKKASKEQTIRPVVPLKQSTIHSRYNEVSLTFRGQLSLCVRVMDNAVAYRWISRGQDSLRVDGETMIVRPSTDMTCHVQATNGFETPYEESYRTTSVSQWKTNGWLATLPALLSGSSDLQILLGETDVDDYPRQFLYGSSMGILGVNPKAPLAWEPSGDRGETITREAGYIAKTSGSRTFPWRWQVITNSRGLIEQTVPVELARPSALKDVSWIKPGQVSWEWWNGATPYGPDVDFKAGNNYETYRYYIDFAAHYGLKYILLDEGWAFSTTDPFIAKPGMRLNDLISYGKERGVGLILWLPWLTVEQHLDSLFQVYESWGIPAVKIDFMNHSDQWMVDFYRRVISEAAKHHIMVDFHGSFTPAGLEQEYPNLMSYEGVRGLEQMRGCSPDNTVMLPFMRNAVGAMDFTPGAMLNYQPKVYRCGNPNAGAMGTRAFQMALYVVFESGFQMLADNPTLYYQNDACTRFISSVPTTWDETRCLAAEVGKYVVVAKRKGDRWFIGGLNNGDGPRTLTISLDFLPAGKPMAMKAFKDGCNANRQAMDYRIDETTVTRTDSVQIDFAQNGGWAAEIN